MKPRLYNSVLPQKVYGVFNGRKRIGQVVADNVHAAFAAARIEFGLDCRSVCLEGTTNGAGPIETITGRQSPMFGI